MNNLMVFSEHDGYMIKLREEPIQRTSEQTYKKHYSSIDVKFYLVFMDNEMPNERPIIR